MVIGVPNIFERKWDTVGHDRYYETMAFLAKKRMGIISKPMLLSQSSLVPIGA